jgi:hypothetical protein
MPPALPVSPEYLNTTGEGSVSFGYPPGRYCQWAGFVPEEVVRLAQMGEFQMTEGCSHSGETGSAIHQPSILTKNPFIVITHNIPPPSIVKTTIIPQESPKICSHDASCTTCLPRILAWISEA